MPTPAQDPLEEGQTLGPYVLIRQLGAGGQGVVHLAEDTRLKRQVALKVLSQGPASDDRLKRFQREAEAASRLEHPNICGIHETGEFEGQPYIAMRLIAGETLAERIARWRFGDADAERAEGKNATATDPSTRDGMFAVCRMIEKVALALHRAHEHGLVHRDVKPGNIMVTPDGEPVVLDFGLARDEMAVDVSLTQSGDLLGTPAYMSPEQLMAQRIPLDRRTDVYSLGATLYECLTLRRPFEAATRAALYQQILADPPSRAISHNRQIPRDLEVVIETALEKNRDRRYQTAEDMAEDLRRVRSFEPIKARPIGRLLRARRWTQRYPARAMAVAGLVVALIVALVMLGQVSRTLGEMRVLALADASEKAAQTDQMLGLLLAREAAQAEMRPETFAQLQKVLFDSWELRMLRIHDQPIFDMAVSPDGSTILTASFDQTAALVDVADGRRRATLAHDSRVRCVAFHPGYPNPRIVLTAEDDGTTSLWDIDKPGQPVKVLDASSIARDLPGGRGTSAIGDANFSSDGQQVVTGSFNGGMVIWDLTTTTPAQLVDTGHNVHHTEFWPGDDNLVISTHVDGRARLWDLRRPATPIREYEHCDSQLNKVAIAADGRHFVTTGSDRRAVLWDRDDDRPRAEFVNHYGSVRAADLSPDGRWLVTASSDHVVRVFDRRTRELVAELRAHIDVVRVVRFLSNEQFISGSADGTVRFWGVGPTAVREYRGSAPMRSIDVSPDGTRIVTGSEQHGEVLLWERGSGLPVGSGFSGAGGSIVHCVEFSGDGSKILAADNFLRMFGTATGEGVAPSTDDWANATRWTSLGANDTVLGVKLLTRQVYRWNRRTKAMEILFGGQTGFRRVYASPHNPDLALLLHDEGAWFGDVATGARRGSLDSDATILRAAFSPVDPNQVVASAADHIARVFDRRTGEVLVATSRHGGAITSVCFHPDGRRFATSSFDGTARLWGPAGDLLALFTGHRGPVHMVKFTPDGKQLVTASGDRTARLWFVDPEDLVRIVNQRLQGRRFPAEDLQPYRQLLGGRFEELLEAAGK